MKSILVRENCLPIVIDQINIPEFFNEPYIAYENILDENVKYIFVSDKSILGDNKTINRYIYDGLWISPQNNELLKCDRIRGVFYGTFAILKLKNNDIVDFANVELRLFKMLYGKKSIKEINDFKLNITDF